MISRLDIKFVLALIVTAFMPMVVSVYFMAEAVGISLGVGLNEDIATSLERSIAVYRNHIQLLKKNQKLILSQIADSYVLRNACLESSYQELEKELKKILKEEKSIFKIIIEKEGQDFLLQQKGVQVSDFRPISQKKSLNEGACKNLEIVFAVDNKFMDEYTKIASYAQVYSTLNEAPQAYLTNRILGVYGILLGVVLIASIVIGVFWTRLLVRRIHNLSIATNKVANGNLDVYIEPGSNDEVGQLINSFNSMVNEISIARSKVEYLQKINAWQDIARRLAHEIKNPLTPIQLAAQQLKEKYNSQDTTSRDLVEQTVEIIEEEVETLRRMVTDFSSFAKLPGVTLVKQDIGEFFKDCQQSFSYIAQQENVVLTWKYPKEKTFVLIDAMMLKRVLDNLVRNALDALLSSSVSKPQIWISAYKAVGKNERNVKISVQDNGPGISEECFQCLFEPYYTTKDHGTGLGLAISKKIVLEHNGQIIVEQSFKDGALFIIILPKASKERKKVQNVR